MGLTECRECGDEVSSRADQCPNCGVKSPGGWLSYTGVGGGGCLKTLGCLGLILLIIVLATMCTGAMAV